MIFSPLFRVDDHGFYNHVVIVVLGSSKHQLRLHGHCSRRCANNMLGIRVEEAICYGEIEYTCVVVVVLQHL
jgi:hypothetical protein